MSRERTVTRTITTTVLNVMTVNIETAEVLTTEHRVPSYTGTAKEVDRIKATLETPEIKVVAITTVGTEENLYTMPESLFIQFADKQQPRGRI